MDEKSRTDVEKMIQGDESAFDELYRSFSGKLYRMAYFITGNQSDSEDVLQETFVKCYLNRKSLKDPERFEAWLYQILVRTAWKLCRKRRDISLDAVLENPDEKGMAQRLCRDENEGPLEQILEQEHAVHLWKLVERLDIQYGDYFFSVIRESDREIMDGNQKDASAADYEEWYEGICLTGREDDYLFLPPDQKPSEEDKSREEAGELYISYGAEKEERCVYKNMMWEKDGLSYTMVTSADKTLEEMAELAKAYMDSER